MCILVWMLIGGSFVFGIGTVVWALLRNQHELLPRLAHRDPKVEADQFFIDGLRADRYWDRERNRAND